MGEKDTTEKILADYNDVFADIINGLVFKGEQKVTPESLENISTRSVYKGRKNKLHEQERDIVKLWKERDIEFAIYGMENQTLPEKYMPLRILGYDGASYRSQLQKKRKRPVAVLTIVLYFGTDKMWDKPTHLKDVIYIPEGLGEYVNDYKITVFNIAWLTEEEIARFKSDFKIVANFFVHKRKNKDYVSDDKTEIKHVDEVLKLLSAMTGDERYEEILAEKEKGVLTHAGGGSAPGAAGRAGRGGLDGGGGVPGGRRLVGAGVPPGAPAPVPVPELRLLGGGL